MFNIYSRGNRRPRQEPAPDALSNWRIGQPLHNWMMIIIYSLHTLGSGRIDNGRSEEHTSELQSLMRISYAVFCLKKKTKYTRRILYTYLYNKITRRH